MPQSHKTDEIRLPTATVADTAMRALVSLGLGNADARAVLAVLMYAQVRGSTQGLIKIVERTVFPSPAATPMAVNQAFPGVAQLAANGNAGMVVMTRASELATQMAASNGIGLVCTHGTASSTGAIGFYAGKIAQAGMIGVVLAGSPPTTAVYGGVDPVLGTNPIAIAAPGSHEALVFDMATAATTVFGLIAARDAQQAIEPGLAWDPNGQDTRDAGAALQGAIRTFGGAKGSGLALMFEILTATLSGAGLPGDSVDNRGNFVLAINPEATVGLAAFKDRLEALTDNVLASRPSDPGIPVRLPGQGARERARQVEDSGLISVSERVWLALQSMAS